MFKVGQKVICKVHGEGVVENVDADGACPVDVDFISGEWDCYTEDGKLWFLDDESSLSVIEE